MHAPAHPLGQLTTGELRTYRRELEHAVAKLSAVPVAAELQKRLDAVQAEEESRENIRQTITPDEIDARMQHHSA
jgi:hypothetical protein